MENDNELALPAHPVVITKDYALGILADFFTALEKATGDTATTLSIITEITSGINADPAAAKEVFTPDNIQRVMWLKRRMDNKTLKPADIAKAFPVIEKSPIWLMIQPIIKKFT